MSKKLIIAFSALALAILAGAIAVVGVFAAQQQKVANTFTITYTANNVKASVGGTYTIDATGAKKVVDKINPKFIIPIHFKTEKSRIDIAPVDEFLSYFEKFDELNTSSVSYDKLREIVTVLKIKEK